MQPTGIFVGAATLDLHYLLPEYPAPDSKQPAERFGIYAGGPAANAAVTFAHLGGTARLYAEVGSHPLGLAVAADLSRHGVDLIDMAAESEAPPILSSIITTADSGDRMVVASHYTDIGPSDEFTGSIPPEAGVLLVDAFLREGCRGAAEQAAQHGCPVVLDGGSWKTGMSDLLRHVDVAICSADFRAPDTATHHEVLDYLGACGIARSAVTRGGDSILFADGGSSGEVPVETVTAVDTLAAGDVFHGAFCYYLATGSDFPTALGEAAAVATRSTQSFGTRAWMTQGPGSD